MEDIFRWRKVSEETPFYNMFGNSNEIIGIDKHRSRRFYEFIRGEWCYPFTGRVPDEFLPIYWHYLPQRPSREEIDNELNNKTE